MMRREIIKEGRLTFLTASPCVSLQAGAHVVPHAEAAIFTRRTADGWRKKNKKRNLRELKDLDLAGLEFYNFISSRHKNNSVNKSRLPF